MDFQQLKLFLHLCESKNFARSAALNHLSPSTLSRQIQRLEEEVGKVLFWRDNRSVELTPTGEQFYQFAEKTLQEWRLLQQQLQPNTIDLVGEIRLFCSVTASYSHLPEILARFRQKHPKVEIQLTTGDPALAVQLVQSRQVDLAIAGEPEQLPDNIIFHQIDLLPFSLIAPKVACVANQLLQQSPINWQEIPFIVPVEGPARQKIGQWFQQKGIKHPKIYATVAGHEGIVPMVAMGFGLALLPDVVIAHNPMNTQITYLNIEPSIDALSLGICVNRKNLQNPVVNIFWEELIQEENTI
ncbi:transcriptional regulator [Gallibacterium genomosp. 3]|uniref:Transcriptional regulator n=1 Tax=Gallibacterium genomosp. 3 TaxID=505345 RepID=A0A1A7NQD6_9PAST|nr:HTH-type transcriptional activator IlvY [Gallibacterium genomosp. 3]OBW91825.1 transcriptional regulator [Gallibacterium genomosp. 3]